MSLLERTDGAAEGAAEAIHHRDAERGAFYLPPAGEKRRLAVFGIGRIDDDESERHLVYRLGDLLSGAGRWQAVGFATSPNGDAWSFEVIQKEASDSSDHDLTHFVWSQYANVRSELANRKLDAWQAA